MVDERSLIFMLQNAYFFKANKLAEFFSFVTTDDQARYCYQAQPEICKWNLIKLAEAIKDLLPLERSKVAVEEMYVDNIQNECLVVHVFKLDTTKELVNLAKCRQKIVLFDY